MSDNLHYQTFLSLIDCRNRALFLSVNWRNWFTKSSTSNKLSLVAKEFKQAVNKAIEHVNQLKDGKGNLYKILKKSWPETPSYMAGFNME